MAPIRVKITQFLIPIIIVTLTACKTSDVKEPAFYPCPEEDFWYAVEEAESGHNSKLVYKEKNGEISAGLFQLSLGDAGRYGCDFKKLEDLFDPVKNANCAENIAAKLRKDHPNESWSRALGRYWSVLRVTEEWPEDPRPESFRHFVKAAAKRGCIVSD